MRRGDVYGGQPQEAANGEAGPGPPPPGVASTRWAAGGSRQPSQLPLMKYDRPGKVIDIMAGGRGCYAERIPE